VAEGRALLELEQTNINQTNIKQTSINNKSPWRCAVPATGAARF
jgi:hypothetical protein